MERVLFLACVLGSSTYLDLHSGDVADGKAKESADCHEKYELDGEEFVKGGDDGHFSRQHDQRHEKYQRVHVVVKRQQPEK